ncbi:MAG: HAMP domain-containing sensor histidine kinase [Bacillota bacterium]|nr:HAMP domain-containing sensor histidine kinase [Bacillota bacterium]
MISDIDWIKRMLSHNVRMPMSIITGYGELLRQGLLSQQEEREIIGNICDNILYMNDVMKVVLDEADEVHRTERVDLVKIIDKITGFVNEMAQKIPVYISIKREYPKMYAIAEEISVMRIMFHLFENAMKYLPPYGNIYINIYYVGTEQVLVVFKDDGVGIGEKDLSHLFEKGYRGENCKGKTGSGYGLYEVKRLMEECGGSVEISSKEDGGFSVYLMFPAGEKKV